MLTVLSIQTHSSSLKPLSSGFILGLNNIAPVYLWDNIHLGLHCYIILINTQFSFRGLGLGQSSTMLGPGHLGISQPEKVPFSHQGAIDPVNNVGRILGLQ